MKTFLCALYCVVQCILYPGSKIIVVSKTLKQATEVLLKIRDDFMKDSPILRTEISDCSIGQNNSAIYFKNGSWMQTRTSTDNARSARANIIVVDEFVLVNERILDSVIRKFLAAPRSPKYLNKPEYAHLEERNKEIYLSSAYFKSSWAYKKAQSYTVNFFNDKQKYFICGIPYQVSIKEGLLMKEQLLDEISELGYDETMQQMEINRRIVSVHGNVFEKITH